MIDEWTWCQTCALVQGGLRDACSRCGGPVTELDPVTQPVHEPEHASARLMFELRLALGDVAIFETRNDDVRSVDAAAPGRRISVLMEESTGHTISWVVLVAAPDLQGPPLVAEHGEADTFDIKRLVELFKTGLPDARDAELARLRSEVARLQASHAALAKIAEDIGEVIDAQNAGQGSDQANLDYLVARVIALLDQVGPGEPRT